MPDILQYVNLDPAESHRTAGGLSIPAERCGPTITLTATVDPAAAGRRIFWGIQANSENVVDVATAAGASGWALDATRGGFSAPGFYEKLQPTNDAGESTVTIDLTHAGGDKFEVKAYTKKPDGTVKTELQSDTYVVWRQLFYQVTKMGASSGHRELPAIPDLPFGDVKQEFDDTRKKHNIRFTEVPSSSPTITRQRTLLTGAEKLAVARQGYDRSLEPLVLKVSLIDLLASKGEAVHRFRTAEPGEFYEADVPHVLFDMNNADDRADWLKTWSVEDATLTRDCFVKRGVSTIGVIMPDFSVSCGRDETSVSVTYYHFTSWLNGSSWYNGIWAIHNTVRWSNPPGLRARTDAGKVGTMIHEWGHAIGMNTQSSPKYYGRATSRSHGHQGGHCWNGKSSEADLGADERFPSSPSAICVMFGDSSRVNNVFCDVCTDFVRSRNVLTDGKFNSGTMLPSA